MARLVQDNALDPFGGLMMVAFGSIFVAFAVLGLKYLAYAMTGSVTLLSDAMESIVNVATAVAALVALRLAARPANARMHYGYFKAEYFSAVLVGVLIVLAAFMIFDQAWHALTQPKELKPDVLGLGVNAVAGGINLLWSTVLIRTGKRYRSPALVADGQHVRVDVVTSAGALMGVALVMLTGWQQLDAVIAMLMGLHVLWNGWEVVKDSVGGLMDVAVPEEVQHEIRKAIAAQGRGALEAHDIRTRQAGRKVFVDFHLVVSGEMTVREAHAICDAIEGRIEADMPDTVVNIHVEPEEKAKGHGGVDLST
jgi:cation diffusion facilitator family transporter